MQTHFTLAQLADPKVAEADRILRACVHCGFCLATCPTYVLLGDELDSPRGRIYLIKQMLENDRPADAVTALHIDRCLSCLACMTTCPSGVHYMHLVDHARTRIEQTYRRPLPDRTMRSLLAWLMPKPSRFRLALAAAVFGKPLAPVLRGLGLDRLAAMLRLAPWWPFRASGFPRSGTVAPVGSRQGRVALLSGCVDPVIAPAVRDAAIRLLTRHGIEVVLAEGEACCGSISHHMGREHEALAYVRNNVEAWIREIEQGGLDAILVTASGCGTTVKDYGYMLRNDPQYAEKAARVSALARDLSEYLVGLDIAPKLATAPVVAYHSPCSMQHGQKVDREPREMLTKAGFVVKAIPEAHLCCGSAGTYNMLQPALAERLLARKVRNVESIAPDVVATGNIGCMVQIASGTKIPVVHAVELMDWATGGPLPKALAGRLSQRFHGTFQKRRYQQA